MNIEDRVKSLERLVEELWDEFQCEQDCRVCAFWRDDPEHGIEDECHIEMEMERLGIRNRR